jgi:hypothetical protein
MTDESVSESSFQPRRTEWLALFGLLAVMFIFNLRTYNLYPTVWADEVLWSEPAINLFKAGHFTTSVWQLQSAGTFWAAQSPLYPLVLTAWLPVAGTSLQGVRSFNYFLVSIGVVLVWFASWRYRLIARASYRLALVPLLLFGYGVTFSYRCSRPDILGMICLTLFALAFSVRTPRWRILSLLVTAWLAPWVGVQIALYVFVASITAKLFFREVTFKDLAVIATGLGIGTASLLLVFYANGVLPNFMGTIFQAANEHMHWGKKATVLETIPRRIRGAIDGYLDFSSWPLAFGLVTAYILYRARSVGLNRRGTPFLLLLSAGIPWVFSFLAHFGFYYSYLVFVPFVLVFLHVFDRLIIELESKALLRAVFAIAVLGSMLLGLPLRLWLAATCFDIVPRNQYAQTIQSALRPDDVVLAHYTGFFEAKQVTHRVYSPMYAKHLVNLTPAAQDFTPEEKQSLTALVLWPHELDYVQKYVGGEWVAVTEPVGDAYAPGRVTTLPFVGRRIQNHFAAPQLLRYKLQVFRRKPVPQ